MTSTCGFELNLTLQLPGELHQLNSNLRDLIDGDPVLADDEQWKQVPETTSHDRNWGIQ